MKNYVLIFLFFCGFPFLLSAQTEYPTENEDFIFWQPSVEIKFSDYQGIIDSSAIRLHEKYGAQLTSSIGFRSVIDIPKKKGRRGGKMEIVYFAPVFCKKCSCVFSNDSTELKYAKTFFDIAELCTRQVRMELEAISKEMNAHGALSIMYTTVKSKWEERMHEMFGVFGREVMVEKKENAYEEWEKMIYESLEKTQDYATTPIECYRFLKGEPIEKDYIIAKTVLGDMHDKK